MIIIVITGSFFFLQHINEHALMFVTHLQTEHLCVTLKLLCVAPSTQRGPTSTVGQSIHGVAFVAQTLKTTR